MLTPTYPGQPTRLQDLPYFADGLWNPGSTGDYGQDCILGRQIARDVLNLIARTDNVALMGTVANAIFEGQMWGGCEIAFFTEVGFRAAH